MPNKKIFISFDYDKDRHYKNLLVAWDKNNLFDFKFYDESVTVAVDSDDAAYIRRKIKEKISAAGYLLCIVGAEAYKSGWIEWEIDTAKSLGLSLIGVKTDSSNTSPCSLLDSGATWARSFTFESIKNAVDAA